MLSLFVTIAIIAFHAGVPTAESFVSGIPKSSGELVTHHLRICVR